MKRMFLASAVVALIAATGCGNAPERQEAAPAPPAEAAAPDPGPAEAAVPMMVDGTQVVRVIVRNTGYSPDRIRLQAGMPVKMVFVQEADSHCASQVQIPDLGVEAVDLPAGQETVVEFSPQEPGTYVFTCGMEMLRGTIEVGA